MVRKHKRSKRHKQPRQTPFVWVPEKRRGTHDLEWWTEEHHNNTQKKVEDGFTGIEAKKRLQELGELPEDTPQEFLEEYFSLPAFPRPHQIKQTQEQAEKLFFQYEGMAFKACRSMKALIGLQGLEKEDFEQIVRYSLWCAALTFDDTLGWQFSTWLWKIVRTRTASWINRFYIHTGRSGEVLHIKDRGTGREVILQDAEDYNSIPLFDQLLVIEALELNYKVNPERDANILVERIMWGYTLQEIGDKLKTVRDQGPQKAQELLSGR